MNNYSNMYLSNEIKKQVDDLINVSGISAQEFVKELVKVYEVEGSSYKEDITGNFNDYCDSFIA